MINNSQSLKGKTKIKFYENLTKYDDVMKYRKQSCYFQFDENNFFQSLERIGKITHKVPFLMKFLQAKPQNKKIYQLL